MSIDVNVTNDLVIVTESSEDITVNVSNAAGPAGIGVPVGGSTGQVLKKFTNTNYDTYWAADASGLTSIGLSMPSAFSVSNSPLTSNGTLTVTGAGDTTQYIAGDGSLVAFPIAGQAGTLVREVRNVTGATLTKGTVVYINGASGNKPTVTKAIATGDSTSAQTFGIVQANIANNSNGYVVAVGDIDGLDTSAFADGAQLYLSATVAGAFTDVKQYAPNHLVYIGVVTRSHVNQGRIEVRIQNGYELDEIHDVAAQTPSNNDALIYESSTSLWKNKTIATALGYTPVPTTRTLTINGTAYDLSADRSWTVSGSATPAGSNTQIQYNNGGIFGASAGFTYNNSTGLFLHQKDQSSFTVFTVKNVTSGLTSRAGFTLESNLGLMSISKTSSGFGTVGVITANDAYLYNTGGGNYDFINDVAAKFIWANGVSNAQMTLTAAGRLLLGTTSESTYLLDVNGTARVSGGLLQGNGTTYTTGISSTSSTASAYIEISGASGNNSSLVYSKGGQLSTMWQVYTDDSNNYSVFRNGINRQIFKIFESTKNVGIDEVSTSSGFNDVASAKLFVNSTSKGFLPPRGTNTQMLAIASPAEGLCFYDTTNHKLNVYDGTTWQACW